MARDKRADKGEKAGGGVEGIFRGLGELVEKLADLAEKGEHLSRSGEVQFGDKEKDKDLKGVFGFSVKMGLGGKDVKVEPFGNVSKDKATGRSVVHEVREPLVDVFEEEDHVLIVAEMPGIEAEDVQVELRDDILAFSAQKGKKKYRKEVLLPRSCQKDKVEVSCKHGIVEIKCVKQ
ncbi:MAG: Hsp20/alpha crystallin family protein [Syntrophobacteraceae bacterium]